MKRSSAAVGATSRAASLGPVVFTHQGAEMYGSDRMALETVEALRAAGEEVVVLIPGTGPLTERLTALGFDVRDGKMPVVRRAALKPVGLLKFAVGTLNTVARAYREFRRLRPRLIYVNTIAQPGWVFAAFLARVPCICHVREVEEDLPSLMQKALVWPTRLCRTVVCNSSATAVFIRRNVGSASRRRVAVVHNGKDWGPYEVTPPPPLTGTPKILVVGRLSPRKGQDLLLEAYPALERAGVIPELHFVGDTFEGYEWFREQLVEEASRLGISDRVHLHGFQTNIETYLAGADIVVVPSRQEPFGTVALEALAAERPTVVSAVQGLTEIIENRVTGLTFVNGDASSLVDAITWCVDNPQEAATMAARGRSHALEGFSVGRYRENIAAVVRAAVEGGCR